jgi:hypothetical protein
MGANAMREGLLWFDADPKRPPTAKLDDALWRYRERFGAAANACRVAPPEVFAHPDVHVVPDPAMLPHHFLVGIDEALPTDRSSRRARSKPAASLTQSTPPSIAVAASKGGRPRRDRAPSAPLTRQSAPETTSGAPASGRVRSSSARRADAPLLSSRPASAAPRAATRPASGTTNGGGSQGAVEARPATPEAARPALRTARARPVAPPTAPSLVAPDAAPPAAARVPRSRTRASRKSA